MTKLELFNRIQSAWECPSPGVIWEFDRRNGYVWKEDGMTLATPGVAVMADGLDDIPVNRNERADALGYEWSWLCHMEQAVNFLFAGNTFRYNDCVERASEPGLRVKYTIFRFKDISQIKELLCSTT